ncbi:hypothetical protein [Nostoc sp.]|uniref:hypothetical protein n=1 Tax=Nostoc sp. TaxID=1180 RepID=UPI002FF68F47
MDFTEINSLVDDAINLVTAFNTQKQAYQTQLASKDQRIAELESQLKTATSAASAEETEIQTLHEKLTQLSGLLNSQTATAAA